MAIDPSQSIPEDVATVQSLSTMTEESAKLAMRTPVDNAFAGAKGSLILDIIGGIGQALLGAVGGIFQPISDAIAPIRSGQLAIEQRADLLEDVQGYASAYMTKNINAAWSFSENWRFLPFDGVLGPSLGATVRSDGRVSMDSTGLWQIFCTVHGRQTNFTGSGAVNLRVRIYLPDGTLYEERSVRGTGFLREGLINTVNHGNVSLHAAFPIVINTPGTYIRVDAWTATWRWWDGGTRLSALSVMKLSREIENRGDQTVPDEDEAGAGT